MRLAARVIAPAFTILFSAGLFFSLSTTRAISGGAPYQVTCPNGTVMVGLEGRTGGWIDQFSVLCNNMSNIERRASPQVGQSGGGSFTRAVCPLLSGVTALEFDYVDAGGGLHVVNKIKLTCEGFTYDSVGFKPVFGQNDEGTSDDFSLFCSNNTFVAQLAGNAWTYIDSIDYVRCRRRVGSN